MEKVTPFTSKPYKKCIMIGCLDFSEMTGMPMYVLRIAKEFMKRGRWVTIVSPRVGGDMEELAKEAGIECVQDDNPVYKKRPFDVLLLNETVSEKYLDDFPNVPAYNFCHSKMEADRPIEKRPQIRGYMAPRKQVSEYWAEQTGYKFDIVPIPIDFEKYVPLPKRIPNYQKRILCVCTFNEIREGMIRSLVDEARIDGTVHVTFVGKDFGTMGKMGELPDNVKVYPETKNPETYIKDCDVVASLYEGTTCFEGWACERPCRVYQDDNTYKTLKPPKDLKITHNVGNVVDKFIEIFERKWADIVIPHHDRPNLLAECLKSIPIRNFNVYVIRGGHYARSCNRATELAETDRIIFLNDDMVANPTVLWNFCDADLDKHAIYGVQQIEGDGTPYCIGIFINQHGSYEMTNDREKMHYPAGGVFVISSKLFNSLKFNEGFINGGEDQDLFLRVIEMGGSTSLVEGTVIHYVSQSSGRFDFIVENDEHLHKLWPEERLKGVFGDDYLRRSEL